MMLMRTETMRLHLRKDVTAQDILEGRGKRRLDYHGYPSRDCRITAATLHYISLYAPPPC